MKTKEKTTKFFKVYMTRLVLRVLVLLSMIYLYLCHNRWMFDSANYINYVGRDWLDDATNTKSFFTHFSPIHILWLILVIGMLIHIFRVRITMGGYKSRAVSYTKPEDPYELLEQYQYIHKMNYKAILVGILWLSFNAIFGALYLYWDFWGAEEMILLSVFYFTCDLICMMLFCPFQLMMGNRCCVNCRIFDWGHIMMYTPMLFVKSFYSWSLLFLAIVVFLRWEIILAKHPERFWRGSNATIRCENCHDKLCYVKKPIITGIDKFTLRIKTPRDELGNITEKIIKR